MKKYKIYFYDSMVTSITIADEFESIDAAFEWAKQFLESNPQYKYINSITLV